MSEERAVNSVAVLGGGTMGAGIAGACALAGCDVLLLDVSMAAAEKALDRILNGRPPAVDDPAAADRITLGTLDGDLAKVAGYDWVCEAVIEDLATKRALFERLEPLRRDGPNRKPRHRARSVVHRPTPSPILGRHHQCSSSYAS